MLRSASFTDFFVLDDKIIQYIKLSSDKIHFPNPVKIQIDGQERDFFIENQAKLSSELINAIRSSNEFWIVDIDTDRNVC